MNLTPKESQESQTFINEMFWRDLHADFFTVVKANVDKKVADAATPRLRLFDNQE